MKFKYIFLDWDGCLIDTLGIWVETYISVYQKYGRKVKLKEIIKKSWGNNEVGPKNIGIKDYLKCWEEIAITVKKNMPQAKLHPFAKELLCKLHESKSKIAIVTSSERRIIEPIIEIHNFSEYIDYLITEGEVTKPKPDPEILLKAIDFFDASKQESIIVGDSSKDIVAGKNAGISSALILHEENKNYYDFNKLMETNPSYIFQNLKDLYSFLVS